MRINALQNRLVFFEVVLVILQFLQLAAHHQQALLRVQGRIVCHTQFFRRQLIDLPLCLLQVGGDGRIALR